MPRTRGGFWRLPFDSTGPRAGRSKDRRDGRSDAAGLGDLVQEMQIVLIGWRFNLCTPKFVRIHQMLGVTPAMAAKVTDRLWEMADVVKVFDEYETSQRVKAA